MYNTTHNADENTTNILVILRNAKKINDMCNVSKVVQDYGIKVRYPLHINRFYAISDDKNKEAETTG